MDTISGFSGKPYEKCVQKKDPGNRKNGVHGARKNLRATRADVPFFPESLTRKTYRKKIPEMTIRLPGLPGNISGFWTVGQKVLVFRDLLRENCTEKRSRKSCKFCPIARIMLINELSFSH
jgi:hypothetical protein